MISRRLNVLDTTGIYFAEIVQQLFKVLICRTSKSRHLSDAVVCRQAL